jgi:hypothetical protein
MLGLRVIVRFLCGSRRDFEALSIADKVRNPDKEPRRKMAVNRGASIFKQPLRDRTSEGVRSIVIPFARIVNDFLTIHTNNLYRILIMCGILC